SFCGFVVWRDAWPLRGDVANVSQCVARAARLSHYLLSKGVHACAMAASQVSAVLAAIFLSRRSEYGTNSPAADPLVRRLDRWSVLAGVEGRDGSQRGGNGGDCRYVSQPPGGLCPRGAGASDEPVPAHQPRSAAVGEYSGRHPVVLGRPAVPAGVRRAMG